MCSFLRKIMKNKQIHSDYPQNVKTLFSDVLNHPKTVFFAEYPFFSNELFHYLFY